MIAIISYGTYSKHMNYGATLHTYAFQEYLKRAGCQSVVIDYVADSMLDYHLKYPVLNFLNARHPRQLLGSLLNWTIGFRANIRKYNKFHSFIQTRMVTTPSRFTSAKLVATDDIDGLNITTFVCESDVIWKVTPNMNHFDKGFLLEFPAATGRRKVAYAPTISTYQLSEEQRRALVEAITQFQAISSREAYGADYLTKLSGRPVEWVLDPVFLLHDQDYSKIAKKPAEDRFVLVYNCMKNDRKMVREAEVFARERGLNLIEVSNFSTNRLRFHHKVICDCGIEEWLGYFMNADYVICNAFHGFCFSVIFRKEVFVFLRDGSDRRMQNITEALGLQERLIHFEDKRIPSVFKPIDYDAVYEHLDIHLSRSVRFIKNHIIETSDNNILNNTDMISMVKTKTRLGGGESQTPEI